MWRSQEEKEQSVGGGQAQVQDRRRPQLETAFHEEKKTTKSNWQWQSVDSAKINNLKWFSCKHINAQRHAPPVPS